MEPCGFSSSNAVLGPPRGATEEQVGSLNIQRVRVDGVPTVVSCWKPTAEELEEIRRTGRVWLIAVGVTMPPVILTGHTPTGVLP